MSEATMSTMEQLLNSSVEELADLKEFKPLPAGEYVMLFDWEKNENPIGVQLIFTVKEVVELAEANEENIALAGAPEARERILCSFFNKEGKDGMGQGQLKNLVNDVFLPTFGGTTTTEALDNAKGAEVRVVLAHRTVTRDGETRTFPKLKSIELA